MALFKPARYADGEMLDLAGAPVRLKVSGKAKHVSLRVDRVRHEVVAVAPSLRRLADAAKFAHERRAWVVQRLAELPQPGALVAGETIRILGQVCVLQPDGRRPRRVPALAGLPDQIVGCGLGAVDPQLVARLIKREAAPAFEVRADAHCAALGVARPPIGLIDARTRWGSCTPAGHGRGASIRLSWRLALAPFEVADYVVAHECAHLLEANHGPRFWALVRRLVGDPAPHRGWLRKQGPALHAFGR